MYLKLLSKWIVLFGTLLIWAIKFVIRPNFPSIEPVHFLLGIAPNLLGSFCLLFGAFWLMEKYFFLFQSLVDLKVLVFFFFSLLVINEYLQLIPFFGRTFDWNDIVSSALGLLSSYFVFGKYYKKHLLVLHHG